MVANIGSSIQPGWPTSTQNFCQNLSWVMNSVSQPSAVGKICAGTM